MKDNWITFEGEEFLSNMSEEDQKKELLDFFVNMMDFTEQTEKEDMYIKLHECLKRLGG